MQKLDLNPIILAIPMFFTLIAIELIYERFSSSKTYRINDTITNINTGILQQLSGTFIAVLKIAAYTWVFNYFHIFDIKASFASFLLALIAWDFCYYWEHRMAHSINLFWGGHIVHHQSEEYNLSVALRQTSTGFIWGIPFYLPMALIGIDPIQFVFVGGINLLYQFWIHTEHIKKLPKIIEAILNTPSHHRVHHGRDPKYIDKNYAGIFIIWDRMFGTFQKEEEQPNYGITTPLKSWNPVYANLSHYMNLWTWLKQMRSPNDGLRLLLNKPGWFPQYLGGQFKVEEVEQDYKKFNSNTDRLQGYITIQFILSLIINAVYFFNFNNYSNQSKVIFALWIVWSTITFGLLFEYKKKWIYGLEILRLLAVPLVIAISIHSKIHFEINSIVLSLLIILLSLFFFYKGIKKSS